jgi:hypothetical protein
MPQWCFECVLRRMVHDCSHDAGQEQTPSCQSRVLGKAYPGEGGEMYGQSSLR